MPSSKPVVLIVATHPILRNAIYESVLLMQPEWEHLEAADLARALALIASRPIDIALVSAEVRERLRAALARAGAGRRCATTRRSA